MIVNLMVLLCAQHFTAAVYFFTAKFMKNLIPGKGVGHKIILKPLSPGQTFIAMIGYITKDQGEPHYQILTHHVSAQVFIIAAVFCAFCVIFCWFISVHRS